MLSNGARGKCEKFDVAMAMIAAIAHAGELSNATLIAVAAGMTILGKSKVEIRPRNRWSKRLPEFRPLETKPKNITPMTINPM